MREKSPKYNQLDLLQDLFAVEKRETVLIQKLMESLNNLKYVRAEVKSSVLGDFVKGELRENLNYAIFVVADLLDELSRFNPEYKNVTREEWFEKTVTPEWVSSAEYIDQEKISGYLYRAEVSMKSLFTGFKDIFKNDKPSQILSYLRTCNNLLSNESF